MQCHRIEELLELLQPAWIGEQDLSLVQFVAKLAEEVDLTVPVRTDRDDMLISPLKMRESDKQAMIPGLAGSRARLQEALLNRPAASSNPGVTRHRGERFQENLSPKRRIVNWLCHRQRFLKTAPTGLELSTTNVFNPI